MEQVIQTVNKTDAEKRIPVLRLEIDYELATLHDAMLSEDLQAMNESKKKLETLRKEFLILKM